MKWIKELTKKDIDGKNLISLFEFKETSLWWWMEYWLYSSYVYHDSFNEIMKAFNILYDVIDSESPDKIIYVKEGKLYDNIIKLIAEKLNIETRKINSFCKRVQFRLAKKTKMFLIKRYFDSRFFIRKNIFSHILKNHNSKNFESMDNGGVEKNAILNYRCDPRSGPYNEPLMKKLRKNRYKVYAMDVNGVGFLNFRIFVKKIKNPDSQTILLEDYISKKEIIYVKKKTRELKRLWNLLKKKDSFRKIFELKGIDMFKIFEPQFSCYFDVRFKLHLIEFISVDNLIDFIKPTAAITPGENWAR